MAVAWTRRSGVHSGEHSSVRSRHMADHGSKLEETGGDASQMAEENLA